MLVITRMKDQTLELWHPGLPPAEIKVTDIRGDKVRFGVTATGYAIHRTEVADSLVGEAATMHGAEVQELYRRIRSGDHIPSAQDIERLGLYKVLRYEQPQQRREAYGAVTP